MWRVDDHRDLTEDKTGVRLGGWSAYVCTERETTALGWQADGKMRACGAEWSLEAAIAGGERASVAGMVTNSASEPRRLEKIILRAEHLQVGSPAGRWSFFKNGYQSWSESRAFQADENEVQSWLTPMNVLQSNPRNPPKGQAGAFTSEMFALMGNLDQNRYLVVGQGERREQFVYINAWLPNRSRAKAAIEIVFDFGGKVLQPGESARLDGVWVRAGERPNELLDTYLTDLSTPRKMLEHSPSGWCSWYYYYKKVSAVDVNENLAEISRRQPNWQVFVLDDGYTTQIGDWLEINSKFPNGLQAVADECRKRGLRPGLWLAPFVARGNSKLFHEFPEWVLRDRKGRPQLAGWNPIWGLEGRFYGLDTTHPDFQTYLKKVIRTAVHDWGFDYLKLDFVYGACLPGRAYDSSLTAAQRLELGYRLIRETVGEDVFLLGCGSPLSPALGWVDGMRIGPDVAPYWDDDVRVRFTRDPHALCLRTALRSILARCGMHRRWWLNDPDCLMMRETETRLTAAERFTLAAAAAVTGGLLFFSDRLTALPEGAWGQIRAIQEIASVCDAQPAQALGFMESEFPSAVWNPGGYLAVFNFSDQPGQVSVKVDSVLADGIEFRDVYSNGMAVVEHGQITIEVLPAHGAVILRVDMKS